MKKTLVGVVCGRPTKQAKLWRENTGQHYPGFVDRPSKEIKVGPVPIMAPKRVNGGGVKIGDDKYRAELDAQRKRAQAPRPASDDSIDLGSKVEF